MIAPPPIDAVPRPPSFTVVVPARSSRYVPVSARGSDVQCYSAASGRSYTQGVTDGTLTWRGPTGRLVAYYSVSTARFVNMTARHSVICSSWKG